MFLHLSLHLIFFSSSIPAFRLPYCLSPFYTIFMTLPPLIISFILIPLNPFLFYSPFPSSHLSPSLISPYIFPSSFLAVRFLLSLLFFTLFPHLSLHISLSLSSLPLLPLSIYFYSYLPQHFSLFISFYSYLIFPPSSSLYTLSIFLSLIFSPPTLLLIFVLSFG